MPTQRKTSPSTLSPTSIAAPTKTKSEKRPTTSKESSARAPANRSASAKSSAPAKRPVPAKHPASGQRIGYVRVSSLEQNPARQLEDATLDQVFEDRVSGKDTQRPHLDAMLRFVRAGDTIVVHSMDRLARNLDDLRRLVNELTGRGVKVQFLKESLTFTGEDSAMSKLLLSVMGAFAEFERELIRERQREGIALAKERGVYTGRKKMLSETQVEELRQRVARGETKANVARDLGISRETLYQYLRTT